MARQRFRKATSFNIPCDEVFAWHERSGALDRLVPPWQDVRVERPAASVHDGERATVRIGVGGASVRLVAEHFGYEKNRQFCDRQIEGPFRHWVHRHRFEEEPNGGCLYKDEIEYELPGGGPASFLGGCFVEHELERLFRFRHSVVGHDLRQHRAAGLAPSRFLVSGSGGLVGSALVGYLRTGGHEVVRLVRGSRASDDEIAWNPDKGFGDDAGKVSGFDFVVHLAGAGIADGRWSEKRKKAIRDSRIVGTRNLVDAIAKADIKPKAFLCASAVGIYGETEDVWVDESSLAARDFLATTAMDWEAEAARAEESGTRAVAMRFGVVMSPRGGALKKMLPVFRMGMGGRLGNGRAYMPWVSIDDVLGVVEHAAAHEEVRGPLNVTAPDPVRNSEFTKTLAHVLGRPTGPRVPAFVLRTLFGEMADAAILRSARVRPAKLLETGYEFVHPACEDAFRHLLGR